MECDWRYPTNCTEPARYRIVDGCDCQVGESVCVAHAAHMRADMDAWECTKCGAGIAGFQTAVDA